MRAVQCSKFVDILVSFSVDVGKIDGPAIETWLLVHLRIHSRFQLLHQETIRCTSREILAVSV